METAIYCRVDQGGNAEARHEALEAQRVRLKEYAKRHGLRIVGCYQDAGYFGHDLRRPGLVQLLKAGEAGSFQAVLVLNRARLFRGNVWEEPKWPFQVISANRLEQAY